MQVVIAAGKLGAFDRVERWAEVVLATAPALGGQGSPWGVLSGAAAYLIFGGRYASAEALLERIERDVGDLSALDPQTTTSLHQARAVLASYAGDFAACLAGFKAALAAAQEAGDRRNGCSIRANLGVTLAELGDFEGAEEALRAAFADADRMGLHDLATVAHLNLGHVLAYGGRLDEARALEQRVVEAGQRLGDPRVLGVARMNLARIALLCREPATAEREARAAAEALQVAPPVRAAAVAVLARALLTQGRAEEALPVARDAFATLESLGMVEEGESLVRLVHAEALSAAGLSDAFAAAIADARTHLLARAAKISDPAWRERFLTAVPDNARTLALASGQ
jgi:tetratricopeptide (TPR) repeat protein